MELRAVMSLLEDSEVFDELRTVSILLAVWRMYPIELGVARRMLGEI